MTFRASISNPFFLTSPAPPPLQFHSATSRNLEISELSEISPLLSCIHLRSPSSSSSPPALCTNQAPSLSLHPFPQTVSTISQLSSRREADSHQSDIHSQQLRCEQKKRKKKERRKERNNQSYCKQDNLLCFGPVHVGSAALLFGILPFHQANVSFIGLEPRFLCRSCGDTSGQCSLEPRVSVPLDGRYRDLYSSTQRLGRPDRSTL